MKLVSQELFEDIRKINFLLVFKDYNLILHNVTSLYFVRPKILNKINEEKAKYMYNSSG